MDIDRILTNLKRRRYEAHYFNTKEEAMDYLAAELKGRTIGLGDSATLAAMGAYDRLSQENDVVDPVHPLPGEKFRDVAKRTLLREIFISSANAMSEQGEIVNIDGTGNRVGAMLYGTRVDTVLPPRASRLHVLDLMRRMRARPGDIAAPGAGTSLADLLHAAAATIKRRSLVLVFEGMDAAGKGGAIRRVTAALDTRQYHVIPIAAPSDEERAQPYLWRFWRRLPRQGKVAIFDRSWYGRVLVERVEGFCSEADWMRAYAEINDFEDQLVSAGAIVVKFWLSVSDAEQLRRFKAREEEAFKRYKITPDDWRNREKWPLYEPAVCDMIDRTSTENAAWTLVEADNKYYARVKILRVLVDKLESALKH